MQRTGKGVGTMRDIISRDEVNKADQELEKMYPPKFDYYKAPSDEVFNEIKEKAMLLWQTYDDTYGYATEKISRIVDIPNVRDNTCYIIAMFDKSNQKILFDSLRLEESKKFMNSLWDKETEELVKMILEEKGGVENE
jgi:hypothetical protein